MNGAMYTKVCSTHTHTIHAHLCDISSLNHAVLSVDGGLVIISAVILQYHNYCHDVTTQCTQYDGIIITLETVVHYVCNKFVFKNQ